MKYLITISIDCDKQLNPENLQKTKILAEETVTKNLRMPKGINIFVNSKVTKET